MSLTLTGVQSNSEGFSLDAATSPARPPTIGMLSTVIGVQPSSEVPLGDAASLPARPVLTGVLSTPENMSLIGENADKLPDIVVNRPDGNMTVTAPNPTANLDPIETFNVDPLSTEDEMDTVDALLSLQDLRDDTKDDNPVNENAELMPIGGVNLPVDVASVSIELDQVQVDHAIAKLTKQEEEEAVANDSNVQAAVDPDTADAPVEDSNSDARLSSLQLKGEFKTTTHALRKTTGKKRTYKCGVCGTRKSSMQLLNAHHR